MIFEVEMERENGEGWGVGGLEVVLYRRKQKLQLTQKNSASVRGWIIWRGERWREGGRRRRRLGFKRTRRDTQGGLVAGALCTA